MLFSVSVNLTPMSPTYQWDHIVFVLLWRAYFTQHGVLRFHPHVLAFPSFLRLSIIIPLSIYTTSCLFIYQLIDTWVGSAFLAVVGNAAVSMSV